MLCTAEWSSRMEAARLLAEREHAAVVHKKIRSEGPSLPSFDGCGALAASAASASRRKPRRVTGGEFTESAQDCGQ